MVESLDDGRHVLIRPLREEDRERERQFINRLSPATRHFRFLGEIKEASPALLDQLMDIDYQQSMAFVALVHEDGELREVGISRYAACCEEGQCECAVTIADDYQGLGLDAVLMRHLIDVARRNGFRQMYSVDSAANRAMRDLCCALGFVGQRDPDDSTQVIHRLAPVARSGAPAAQAEPEQAAGQETGGEQQWVEHVVVE